MQNKQIPQQQVIAVSHQEHFSGPLPPPFVLQKYNDVVPGAAERILMMAEQQSKHRMELEKKVIESDIQKSNLGQRFAFVIVVLGLLIAAYLGVNGHEVAAAAIGGGGLVSLAGIFISSRIEKKQERERAREGTRSTDHS